MGRKRRPAEEVEREKQLRAREPRTPDGRYNVRDSRGYIVKRDTPEYFRVLGVDPASDPGGPSTGEVVDPEEGTQGEGPTIQVTAPTRPFPVPEVQSPVSRKKRQQQAEQATTVLLTLLDGAVGLSLGEGARMLPDEQAMIAEPMARIMARLDPGTSAMLEKWTDPVMLFFGLAMWGARIWTEMSDQNDQGRPPEPEYIPPAPDNGRERQVPTGAPPHTVTASILSDRTKVPGVQE